MRNNFFKKKNHDFQKYLDDKEFIRRLAYLSDVFKAFIDLNVSFQRKICTIIDFVSELEAFLQKMDLQKKNVESKCYEMYKFLPTFQADMNDDFFQKIIHHLSLLNAELLHYFPDVTNCAYIIDSFLVDLVDLPIATG